MVNLSVVSVLERVPAWDLIRIRDFRYLWLANGFGFTGIQMRMMALGWLALELTDSKVWLGVVNGISAIPVILLSLFAGSLADRLDGKVLMSRSLVLLSALSLLVGVLTTLDVINLWSILVVSVLLGAAVAFFQPASQTLVFDTVGRGALVRAVSLNSSLSNLGLMIGPALAGMLIAGFGISSVFYLITMLFVVALVSLVAVRRVSGASSVQAPASWKAMVGTLAYVRRTPHVSWLLLLSTTTLFAGAYFPLVTVYAKEVFAGGAQALGFFTAAQAAGFLAGSLATTALGDRGGKAKVLLAASFTWAVGMVVFGISRDFALSMFCVFVMGVAGMFWVNTIRASLQTSVAEDKRGGVMGLYWISVQAVPLGWILGGGLAAAIGNEAALFVAAGVFVLATLTAYLSSEDLRQMD